MAALEAGTKPPRYLLALESSSAEGGAALLADGEPIANVRLSGGLRHGRELLPAAAGLLARQGIVPAGLWAVGVSSGPGSYTGLRIGVMAAKALAYACGCRLAAVSSLAAVALALFRIGLAETGDWVLTAVDARRDELYVGLYLMEGAGVRPLAEDRALAPEEARKFLDGLEQEGVGLGDEKGKRRLRLAGNGFSAYPELFARVNGEGAAIALPDAIAVGQLAWVRLASGQKDDPMFLQPKYLRRDAGNGWQRDRLIEA
ncbi:MAG: tRNA (adenosine(37)-N6)-threonylcarbamoyltransferase complex dimerization subunit type 1 TsaB [Planctomycetota bacterium]|jgi:tRNA threonylcarbamoyladenosine biosynthesis protein TsaB|nr:tRNA (adenosine(37)-N6)-threonylcarbamoyltransferase complex dimerization subunit type 1 TsaB [Planctomycetota bacterium]